VKIVAINIGGFWCIANYYPASVYKQYPKFAIGELRDETILRLKKKNKGMKTIIVIGMTGTGKSPWVRDYIGIDRACVINDIQNEYGNKPKYADQIPMRLPADTTLKRSRYIGQDLDEYLSIVAKKKNTVCVFEEATMFFQGRRSAELTKIMINKMFTKNVYIFCFHSIVDVPPGIMRISDYVVLHKTADEEKPVQQKYPRLYDAFMILRKQGGRISIKIV
jgi:hypothetical protein